MKIKGKLSGEVISWKNVKTSLAKKIKKNLKRLLQSLPKKFALKEKKKIKSKIKRVVITTLSFFVFSLGISLGYWINYCTGWYLA